MLTEGQVIERTLARAHAPALNVDEVNTPTERPMAMNPPHPLHVKDWEKIDYRHDDTAGTGEGSVSKPEGPSQI